MDYDLYIKHYRAFDAEFFPSSSIEEIEDKMLEEMDELSEEMENGGAIENKISEATDTLNINIKLLNAYGVKDVLHAGFMKLQETAEKYRKQGLGNAP